MPCTVSVAAFIADISLAYLIMRGILLYTATLFALKKPLLPLEFALLTVTMAAVSKPKKSLRLRRSDRRPEDRHQRRMQRNQQDAGGNTFHKCATLIRASSAAKELLCAYHCCCSRRWLSGVKRFIPVSEEHPQLTSALPKRSLSVTSGNVYSGSKLYLMLSISSSA